MDPNVSVREVLAFVADKCEAYLQAPSVATDRNLAAIVHALRPFCEGEFPKGAIATLANGLNTLIERYGARKELYWILCGNRNIMHWRIKTPRPA